jgi:hypothetical protein
LGTQTTANVAAEPLRISIGDFPLCLRIPEEGLREKANSRYRDFSHGAGAGFEIALKRPDMAEELSPAFEYTFEDAKLLLGDSQAEFLGVRHEYALDSLIRILLTVALLPRQGFLLHAASVVRNGRAYVFMGRSGAGKSTVASLSPEGSVLTDEISLIRFERDGWRAHGTPFWGEFRAAGHNRNYPIAGIYCLTQAPEDRVIPVKPKELLRAMLPCVLFFSPEREANEALLNILMKFVREVPCFQLRFRKDAAFWDEVAA